MQILSLFGMYINPTAKFDKIKFQGDGIVVKCLALIDWA